MVTSKVDVLVLFMVCCCWSGETLGGESSVVSSPTVPQIQIDALKALFDATNGPAWDINHGTAGNWNFSLNSNGSYVYDPCAWEGVTCVKGTGILQELDFNFYSLDGTLPPQLGNLKALTSLWLSLNHIGGSLPSELGQLTSLAEITLYENQITGTIPAAIGNMKSLTLLQLYTNKIRGTLPSELGKLTAMIDLDLHHNQITGTVLPAIGNMKSLTHFDI